MTHIKEMLNTVLTVDVFALIYLAAGVLFILGIKGLAHPATARRGNLLAMAGMAVAMVTTLLLPEITNYGVIMAGLALGALVGVPVALKIDMKAMPQLVALLNSFVGLAATVIALGMLLGGATSAVIELFMGAWIGAITFTGSVIAFGKLSGRISGAPLVFRGQHLLNLLLFIGMIVAGVLFILSPSLTLFVAFTALALVLGVTLILPIGGADMPVVVSMLNSYSGWAAAATGFTLGNMVLVIAGALIGASGAILTYIMCKAMNRSFISVMLGGFGAEEDSTAAEKAAARDRGVKEAAVDDMAYMVQNAESVVIVPGYGMAVAGAQHALKEVMTLLEGRDIQVSFAIHPVAGRMPGHMNVLLAEADVPYENVREMDDINNDFASTDVVIVLGANDVVNPDAKEDPGSPLYGMPILEAYKAKMVYVVKRSMNAGYAGVENTLFYNDNTYMVFGDGKNVGEGLAAALKEVG